MARNYICAIVILLGVVTSASAHKEPTHQQIVREAYKLLKKSLGTDIPEMVSHVGDHQHSTDPRYPTINDGYIVGGAWEEDLVNYQNLNKSSETTVSTSHFWRGDDGDGKATHLVLERGSGAWGPDPIFGIIVHIGFNAVIDDDINAYQKASNYINGTYDVTYRVDINSQVWDEYVFQYDYLPRFYCTGNIYLKVIRRKYITSGNYIPTTQSITVVNGWRNFETVFGMTETIRKNQAWYLFGRVLHLLGDMSVPAHSHNDQHAFPRDLYENSMNVDADYNWSGTPIDVRYFPNRWLADDVYNEKGKYIDPFLECSGENPLHYMMYTTNQMAGHFASWHESGDNNLGGDGTTREKNDITAMWGSFGGITDEAVYRQKYFDAGTGYYYGHIDPLCQFMPNYAYINDVAPQRDNVYTYVIRATAGMMLWFAKETGLLESCPSSNLTVSNLTITGTELYQAQNTITAGPNVIVSSGANVTMRAGSQILLEPGFSVNSGAVFHAYIDASPCEFGCGPHDCTDNDSPQRRNIVAGGPSGGYTKLGDKTIAVESGEKEKASEAKQRFTFNIDVVSGSSSEDAEQLAPHTASEDLQLTVYPNPFKQATTISYTLKQAETVSLKVYDVLGKEIAVLVDGATKAPGTYQASFVSLGLPPGGYFCKLQTSTAVITKRIIIMK